MIGDDAMIRRRSQLHIMRFTLFCSIIYISIAFIILTSCSSTMSSSSLKRRPGTGKQIQLQEHAQSFIGIPYRYGGTSRRGMDCSGFVIRIFLDVYGMRLPHKTTALYRKGVRVTIRSLRIGDLVFFQDPGQAEPSHVGMYLGDGRFIHASSSRGVIISGLNEKYYRNRFIGARRILIN